MTKLNDVLIEMERIIESTKASVREALKGFVDCEESRDKIAEQISNGDEFVIQEAAGKYFLVNKTDMCKPKFNISPELRLKK